MCSQLPCVYIKDSKQIKLWDDDWKPNLCTPIEDRTGAYCCNVSTSEASARMFVLGLDETDKFRRLIGALYAES